MDQREDQPSDETLDQSTDKEDYVDTDATTHRAHWPQCVPNCINRRDSARCDCELGNHTVNHVLLECPLHQDERDWMRSALSDQGIALRREELLMRPEARTIVADFMVKTCLLGQFQAVDPIALDAEEAEERE